MAIVGGVGVDTAAGHEGDPGGRDVAFAVRVFPVVACGGLDANDSDGWGGWAGSDNTELPLVVDDGCTCLGDCHYYAEDRLTP